MSPVKRLKASGYELVRWLMQNVFLSHVRYTKGKKKREKKILQETRYEVNIFQFPGCKIKKAIFPPHFPFIIQTLGNNTVPRYYHVYSLSLLELLARK